MPSSETSAAKLGCEPGPLSKVSSSAHKVACLGRLTYVKLKALLVESVAAAPGLPMLLQDQHTLPSFGEDHSSSQASVATPNDDGIKLVGNLVLGECWNAETKGHDQHHFLLKQDRQGN